MLQTDVVSKPKAIRCANCPLYGKSAVGIRGPIDAPVIFIGEAPGMEEIHTGKPFTGLSGKLFERTCNAVGIDTSQVLITNTLYCPQPRTSPGVSKESINACHNRLFSEITAYPRSLIVLMGGTALKAFTGDFNAKITRARGKVFDSQYGPVIATLHPAAILRNTREFRTFYQDFKYISQLIQLGDSARKTPGKVHYEIVTKETLGLWRAGLSQYDILAADIETSGFDAYKDEILCLGICYSQNKVVIFPKELLGEFEVHRLFETDSHRWIWHNGKFDTKFLRKIGIDARVDEDTMLMHYVLDERPGTHDLKQLASTLLGAEDYESALYPFIKKRGFVSYGEIPTDILYEYLANDCDMTYQLYQTLSPNIDDCKEYKRHYALLIRASEFLQSIEDAGMLVDMEYLNKLEKELTQRLSDLDYEIQDMVYDFWNPEQYKLDTHAGKIPMKFNPSSPKQLSWLLYSKNAMGLSVPEGFPNNTAASTLEALPEEIVVPLVLDYRHTRKALGTYVEGIRDRTYADGRIHPTFSLHTVETGRLSSQNPNAQNFTRGSSIRNMIIAEDGNILIEADYSQAELRCMAWYSRDENLIAVYRNGQDLHNIVAEQYHPGWASMTDLVLQKELRVDAKSINFGIAYGKTAYSFSKERDLTLEEAQKRIDDWFTLFPDVKVFLDYCQQIGLAGGVLWSPFGRARRFHTFPMMTNEDRAHIANEARNFPIQSLASDLTLLSAMDMLPHIKSVYKGKIVNIVHDSILVEAPNDTTLVAELRKYIEETMRQTPTKYIGNRVPFEADSKIGTSWGNMHE